MIFAGWAARFDAARWTGRVLRTGAVRQNPAGQGLAGFSAINRSEVREAASRTGRKHSAGAGVWGHGRRDGTKLAQTAKLLFGAAAAGRRRFQKKQLRLDLVEGFL